jgi:hypothetical protein
MEHFIPFTTISAFSGFASTGSTKRTINNNGKKRFMKPP